MISNHYVSNHYFKSNRCYVDDIFALFSSPDHADKFKEYLSSKHPNINFSIEKNKDGCLPFLDVKIFHKNVKIATNVYRKKTFSGIYTNFKSFITETYKIGLIKSLSFRCFSLCSDFTKFHYEIDKLKSILYKNSYPHDFKNFSILATNNNNSKVTLMGCLLINRDHPRLNKNKQSFDS